MPGKGGRDRGGCWFPPPAEGEEERVKGKGKERRAVGVRDLGRGGKKKRCREPRKRTSVAHARDLGKCGVSGRGGEERFHIEGCRLVCRRRGWRLRRGRS